MLLGGHFEMGAYFGEVILDGVGVRDCVIGGRAMV